MNKSEENYIKHCKTLIEERLCWFESNNWKQRDFLNLIGLIETKTGICLSLSTIKRIWKVDYNGIPHPSTLDAFAQFLDYTNWLEFKTKNEAYVSELISTPKNWDNSKLKSKKFLIVLTIIIIFSVIGIIIFQSNYKPESTSGVFYNPNNVEFTCNTSVARGVPNTVIFTYDASNIKADSFFIQQSWDRYRRDKIQKHNTKLTSTYMYPGYHKAKLIANDSIVKEVGVRVNTNGWLAMARFSYSDISPTYIKTPYVQTNGKLHISLAHLSNNKVEINKSLMASYFLVDNFEGLSSSNFTFETRVKCDSILNINCPFIGIVITGEGDMNYIPLIPKGCVGEAFVKIGDTMMSGKDNDLSAFGTNINKWQHVKMLVVNKNAKIFLNDKLVLETSFNNDINEITGCNLNFSGTGSVDFVDFYNEQNELVYSDDF
ncbi:MAG: hypothetical protein PF517_02715 [Salinivirgaceae bacterium]|jgi:hypothetical protein|nr:hypothetical protein [Salinivirgaceae bacterium]